MGGLSQTVAGCADSGAVVIGYFLRGVSVRVTAPHQGLTRGSRSYPTLPLRSPGSWYQLRDVDTPDLLRQRPQHVGQVRNRFNARQPAAPQDRIDDRCPLDILRRNGKGWRKVDEVETCTRRSESRSAME